MGGVIEEVDLFFLAYFSRKGNEGLAEDVDGLPGVKGGSPEKLLCLEMTSGAVIGIGGGRWPGL